MADEHESKIVITGEDKGATNTLKRIFASFTRVTEAVRGVMRTLGQLNWAVNGFKMLLDGARALGAWLRRDEIAARELRRQVEQARYDKTVNAAAEAYKKLNEQIARSNKLEQERNAIIDRRQAKERDLEDAGLELKKQREIAALNPDAADYAERKRAIEDKYAAEQADKTESRTRQDAGTEASRLRKRLEDKEAEIQEKEASWRASLDRARAAKGEYDEMKRMRPWIETGAIRGESIEDFDARMEELRKRYARNTADADAKAKDVRTARDEANMINLALESAMGEGFAANLRASAVKAGIENRQREDTARRKAEDDRKKADEDRRNAERERAVAREKELAALDPSAADYDARKRAVGRKYDRLAAQAEGDTAALLALDREEREDAAREAGRTIDKANEARIDRAGSLDAFADRLAATQGVSANRLTAMGLGSGVSPREGALVGEVRKLADLMREEIEATKANKPARGDGTATYGE